MEDFLKKVPPWAWWIAGAILLVIVLVALFRHRATGAEMASGGAPAPPPMPGGSLAPSQSAPSVYSPTTTTTENITYSPYTSQVTTTTTTYNIKGELPGSTVGSGARCEGAGCAGAPGSTGQPGFLSLADIEAKIHQEQELWAQAHAAGLTTAEKEAHKVADAYRRIAMEEGLGTLVPGPAGYEVLKLPTGQIL